MLERNKMYIRENFDGADYEKYIEPGDNLKILKCCFAGHSDLCGRGEEIGKRLEIILNDLREKYDLLECYVGDYGEFDRLVAGTVHRMVKNDKPMDLKLVIPYLTSRITAEKNTYYDRFDDITIANIPPGTPIRLGIIKTNQFMVDKCDLLICYVKHNFGGAAKTLEHAQKKKLEIINLADTI